MEFVEQLIIIVDESICFVKWDKAKKDLLKDEIDNWRKVF